MTRDHAFPTIALCLEQTLGHRAHSKTLVEAADRYESSPIDVFDVDYVERGRLGPPWALRGSYSALRSLRRAETRFDVALFHTQTVSLLAPLAPVRRYVVSVDATPVQMDEMGSGYDHKVGARPVEALKRRWYQRVFAGASRVVAWSEWAAQSLIADYAVAPEKIRVLHPGAPQEFFEIDRARVGRRRPNILFVGGDFERKGGPELLAAFDRLKPRAELTLVTTAPVGAIEGMRVVANASPGSQELISAYEQADIFCLPTRADCTSVAIGEAMAAGLPVVTTTVGSNPTTAPDGKVGRLITPGDADELYKALDEIVGDDELRLSMGQAARRHAGEHMRASVNSTALIELVRGVCVQQLPGAKMELAG